jgi:hypothetical protein
MVEDVCCANMEMETPALSLTLQLSDEEATVLHAKAAAEGLSLGRSLPNTCRAFLPKTLPPTRFI